MYGWILHFNSRPMALFNPEPLVPRLHRGCSLNDVAVVRYVLGSPRPKKACARRAVGGCIGTFPPILKKDQGVEIFVHLAP